MIEKIYKKAIYALARVAVKYIELRKKREQKKIKQNKSANLTNSTKSCTDAESVSYTHLTLPTNSRV